MVVLLVTNYFAYEYMGSADGSYNSFRPQKSGQPNSFPIMKKKKGLMHMLAKCGFNHTFEFVCS